MNSHHFLFVKLDYNKCTPFILRTWNRVELFTT